MRAPWDALHQILIRSLTTSSSVARFRELRAGDVALAPFATSGTLLELLARRSLCLDETDQIYAALARAAQAGMRAAQMAHTLLMCGLWPGLDRFYRRRVERFHDDPHELAAAISGTFTLFVADIDLRSVRRIAATLVRSTGREVTTALRRAREQVDPAAGVRAHGSELDVSLFDTRHDVESEAVAAGVAPNDDAPVQLGLLVDPRRPDEVSRLELQRLHRTLRPVLPQDTELVLRVLVLEEREYEAAARLGITPGTARKRLQRARVRLRTHLDRIEALSSAPERRPASNVFTK